jgi:YHS domain-containing protein
MKILSVAFLATNFVFATASSVKAQPSRIDTLKYCVVNHQTGIGGYDPVSYFTSGIPSKGTKSILAVHEGVQYFFVNDQNRKAFANNPEKYLPQFGGWCSMTLAMGRATQPTFDNFLISSGKLYLFERTLSLNGKEIWLKDIKINERLATNNYSNLLNNRTRK